MLEPLQELTRFAVQTSTGERTRLMLDVAGHRAARREALEKVATSAVEEVAHRWREGQPGPMTPFEREVVHDAVAAAACGPSPRARTPGRHVVVLPA